MCYDELYDKTLSEAPVDEGFARGIFHANLEGLRAGVLSGFEQEPRLPW